MDATLCTPNKTGVSTLALDAQAVPKAAGAGDAADGGNSGEDRSVEEAIKTCCDTMQNSLQREFDRNLDLFDFCVKKAVSGATASAREAAAESASAAMGAAPGNKGVSPSDNSAGVTLGATNASREGVRDSTGGDPTSCKRGGSRDEWRDSEMEEGAVPKRLEDEKALDAEIHRLRKRRREVRNVYGLFYVSLHVITGNSKSNSKSDSDRSRGQVRSEC